MNNELVKEYEEEWKDTVKDSLSDQLIRRFDEAKPYEQLWLIALSTFGATKAAYSEKFVGCAMGWFKDLMCCGLKGTEMLSEEESEAIDEILYDVSEGSDLVEAKEKIMEVLGF